MTNFLSKKNHSDKEISIFIAVLTLLHQGKQLHELTMASIAEKANIGKSTAYEYFTSKEQLLKEAIEYFIVQEYESLYSIMQPIDDFKHVVNVVMDYLEKMICGRLSNLLVMFVNLDYSQITDYFLSDPTLIIAIKENMLKQVRLLHQLGHKQQLISSTLTTNEVHYILNGFFSAFINEARYIFMINQSLDEKDNYDEKIRKLKETTLQLILKALQ